MERSKKGEIILTSFASLSILAVSFLGFSQIVKDMAVEIQGGKCPVCGQALCTHQKVEAHHKLPKSKGGNNLAVNCVMVGGDKDRDCHEKLDKNAFEKNVIYVSPDQPEVPISQAPICLFKRSALSNK